MILLDTSGGRVKEAVLDLALELQRVFVVRPLNLLVGKRSHKTAPLVLVAKSNQRRQIAAKAVIRLVVKLVAIRILALIRNEEGSSTRARVSVRTANRDHVAEI